MGLSVVHGTFVPPPTQTAIVADNEGKFIVWNQAPTPPAAPDQIYVRTEAVAVNPSDTKMIGDFQSPFTVLGTDFSGTVVAVGSEVPGVQVGDRICGASHGMSELRPDRGAFAQYNVTIGNVWLKIPDSMSFEQGASLCAGLCTAGLAIRSLGLPMPDAPVSKPERVLVYGGSTATGTLAIQLLRL
jgi:NADPH:quinone reductase-like Zn-dependent oxidoreductase